MQEQEAIMLSEISQDRERQMLYDTNDMWNLKYNNNKCMQHSRRRLTDMKNKLVLPEGRGKGGVSNQGYEIKRYKPL